ncbi:MAG: hypothetical protein A2270_09510 [Elusimicrobia bacterium RIFOXYA12_FULL_51_18]|nr:MAG: hypothetical protein A2270_09510 [Elusimicrobia bacterium RIFOXYA12_FULL_51_18]OGS32738.1 MAG: hypothetical protein A2218_11825 [Elusimicrobia bacterium RIFOXYA2_FULL_53_38]
MKKQENKTIAVRASLKDQNLDVVRYAAYAVSDAAYVFIKPAGKRAVALEFTPKSAAAAKDLLRRFKEELADEQKRAAIFASNRDLREFMILKALAYEEIPPSGQREDSGLTPEQERELDALIAQVESEIKKESFGKKVKDPLGITRTWEEKYGAKTGRKK